jgi:hypothetical protein
MRNIEVLAGALVLAWSVTARADDTASAEAAFQEARRLSREGRHAEACPRFEASYRAAPALGALLNLADCHERIGRTATAWAEFREAAELARRRVDSRESFALERAAALESRLVRLRIALSSPPPPGLVVRRGPSDLTTLLGSAIPVDPGEHVIEASAPGHVTWTAAIEVRGEGRTVDVAVPALVAAPPGPVPPGATAIAPAPAAPAVDDRAVDPGRRRRWIALSVGGAGIAAVGAGLVVGARSLSRWDDSRAHCAGGNVCDRTGRDTIASAQRLATVSDVLVGVGLAAIAGGAVLWVTAPSAERPDEDPDLVLAPALGGDHLGATLTGRF